MVNNHGDRFCPPSRVISHKNGLNGIINGESLSTYDTWDDRSQVVGGSVFHPPFLE